MILGSCLIPILSEPNDAIATASQPAFSKNIFHQYIGFPVGANENFGNDIKPLGIFVGTLED